jgi:hypothetical protein
MALPCGRKSVFESRKVVRDSLQTWNPNRGKNVTNIGFVMNSSQPADRILLKKAAKF